MVHIYAYYRYKINDVTSLNGDDDNQANDNNDEQNNDGNNDDNNDDRDRSSRVSRNSHLYDVNRQIPPTRRNCLWLSRPADQDRYASYDAAVVEN